MTQLEWQAWTASSLISGDYGDAIAHYQRSVEAHPDNFDLIGYLGLAHWLQGDRETAQGIWWDLLANLELAGKDAEGAANELMAILKQEADRLFQQERYDLAIGLYEQLQEEQPDNLEIGMNLGFALAHQGALAAAMACYQGLLTIDPNNSTIWYNLAGIWQQQGDLEQAIVHYQRALILNPYDDMTGYNLGVVLTQQGRLEEAIAIYHQLLKQQPEFAHGYFGLGVAFEQQGQEQEAIAAYQKAIELDPNFTEAYTNLGVLSIQQGKLIEAEAYYQQAIQSGAQSAEAFNNLGALLISQHRFEEAMTTLDQAIVHNPNYPEAHCNRALLHLRLGNLPVGFSEHEQWRWLRSGKSTLPFFQPIWDGTDLQGRTLLLWAEQGFGDNLQFCRYLPWIAQLGKSLVLECPSPLARLFQLSFPAIPQLIERGRDPLPPFDVHLPLTSLPWHFGTTLDNIPATIPYLTLPPEIAPLPGQSAAGLNIGIVWGSKPHNAGSRSRSCPLREFQGLLSLPGIRFYSLQKGEPLQELAEIPEAMRPLNLEDRLQDFADTASVISQLDLVITIDTAVAHLAGALGKPVWVLLTWFADWRWLHDRLDSPWYPTMRLFRQPQPGDWRSVLASVTAAVKLLEAKG